jgi:RNA polymerase sigma-70 factor (ECF subfamily)
LGSKENPQVGKNFLEAPAGFATLHLVPGLRFQDGKGMSGTTTGHLQNYLDRLRQGDSDAREALLANSRARLLLLTRKMLRLYPRVRRREESDDVVQNVLVRLDRMLDQVAIRSVRDYLRLAATNIRRELIDLARHYCGPQGAGAHEVALPGPAGNTQDLAARNVGEDTSNEPARLAAWTELHQQIERLPDEECEVFDLLWYQGLSQTEAAALLAVSVKTVRLRWQSARLNLMKALGGELPF